VGGAAGFVAAAAAGRAGRRTLLIERYGLLGGTATAGTMVEFGSPQNHLFASVVRNSWRDPLASDEQLPVHRGLSGLEAIRRTF